MTPDELSQWKIEVRKRGIELLAKLQESGQEYSPPFGTSAPQPPEELIEVHERWIDKLKANPPEGVPLDKNGWPATFGDRPTPDTILHRLDEGEGYLFQCGNCCYCVTLEGSLGGDWGTCSNPKSQYDGQAVFEHWTCRHFRWIEGKEDEDR